MRYLKNAQLVTPISYQRQNDINHFLYKQVLNTTLNDTEIPFESNSFSVKYISLATNINERSH